MVNGTRPSPYEYEKRKMREAAVPNADCLANRIMDRSAHSDLQASRVTLRGACSSRWRPEPCDRREVPTLAQAHPGNGLGKIPRP